jgi:hypothetical protein
VYLKSDFGRKKLKINGDPINTNIEYIESSINIGMKYFL